MKQLAKCAVCGSTKVEVRAWVRPNDNNSFAFYCDTTLEETETCYCHECGGWQSLKVEAVSVPQEDPWRCSACGSLNVECRTWADANTGEGAAGDDSIEYRCLDCDNENVIQESEYLPRVEEWWSQTGFAEKQEITGIRTADFPAGEQYEEVCQQFWRSRTNDQKISFWQKFIYPEIEQ